MFTDATITLILALSSKDEAVRRRDGVKICVFCLSILRIILLDGVEGGIDVTCGGEVI